MGGTRRSAQRTNSFAILLPLWACCWVVSRTLAASSGSTLREMDASPAEFTNDSTSCSCHVAFSPPLCTLSRASVNVVVAAVSDAWPSLGDVGTCTNSSSSAGALDAAAGMTSATVSPPSPTSTYLPIAGWFGTLSDHLPLTVLEAEHRALAIQLFESLWDVSGPCTLMMWWANRTTFLLALNIRQDLVAAASRSSFYLLGALGNNTGAPRTAACDASGNCWFEPGDPFAEEVLAALFPTMFATRANASTNASRRVWESSSGVPLRSYTTSASCAVQLRSDEADVIDAVFGAPNLTFSGRTAGESEGERITASVNAFSTSGSGGHDQIAFPPTSDGIASAAECNESNTGDTAAHWSRTVVVVDFLFSAATRSSAPWSDELVLSAKYSTAAVGMAAMSNCPLWLGPPVLALLSADSCGLWGDPWLRAVSLWVPVAVANDSSRPVAVRGDALGAVVGYLFCGMIAWTVFAVLLPCPLRYAAGMRRPELVSPRSLVWVAWSTLCSIVPACTMLIVAILAAEWQAPKQSGGVANTTISYWWPILTPAEQANVVVMSMVVLLLSAALLALLFGSLCATGVWQASHDFDSESDVEVALAAAVLSASDIRETKVRMQRVRYVTPILVSGQGTRGASLVVAVTGSLISAALSGYPNTLSSCRDAHLALLILWSILAALAVVWLVAALRRGRRQAIATASTALIVSALLAASYGCLWWFEYGGRLDEPWLVAYQSLTLATWLCWTVAGVASMVAAMLQTWAELQCVQSVWEGDEPSYWQHVIRARAAAACEARFDRLDASGLDALSAALVAEPTAGSDNGSNMCRELHVEDLVTPSSEWLQLRPISQAEVDAALLLNRADDESDSHIEECTVMVDFADMQLLGYRPEVMHHSEIELDELPL